MLSSSPAPSISDDALVVPPGRLVAEMAPAAHVPAFVAGTRQAVRRILDTADDRLLVVIGPCSIHDPLAALDYAGRLAEQRIAWRGELEIVMRAYFEKPRTTVGWKGLINDPRLDGSGRIDEGLRVARQLLLDVNGLGVPTGCEFLDTVTPAYLADLVSWGAIGARTAESQVHRQLASGLPCPVGFKNGTTGEVGVALDAVAAAAHPQRFLGVMADGRIGVVATPGNRDGHVVLRGGRAPNYDAESVAAAGASAQRAGLPPRLMIDASHANSGKNPDRQAAVIEAIARQVAAGGRTVVGVMIESNLVHGRQDIGDGRRLVYGQSITDGCIDWPTSVGGLEVLADAVRARRRARDSLGQTG